MAISFRCPNGHRLKCPDERAGQPGKCPKCGAAFHVPTHEEASAERELVGSVVAEEGAVGESGAGGSAVGRSGTGSAVRAAMGSGVGSNEHAASQSGSHSSGFPDFTREDAPAESAAKHEEQIVFLCPNGHRLNAPAKLQGKPGKCPHCGEKFLVPMLEEEQPTDSGNFGDILGDQSSSPPPTESHEPVQVAAESGFNFGGFTPEDEFTAGLIESSTRAMADLFGRLWTQRGETGIVELYLKGGEILSPHWYAPNLSHHAYGMFAFQEQDGSHTLTAVHWDAIERIALRGLPQLPPGIFES